MSKLPDLEGLAIFAKVVETRSFAGAAAELKLSNATVSKAVSRVEAKLKTRLFNRTSRRIAMTEAGRQLSARAAHILSEGEAAEDEALARSTAAEHVCITYGHAAAPESWRFTQKNGKSATVRPTGPLRVNNGDAMMPALIAGTGLAVLPEFIVHDALADGRLERLLPEWSMASGSVYWVTPPGGQRPKRVDLLGEFVAKSLIAHRRGAQQ
jgi:DNA-binding transcriptional LysR family regulator